MNDSAQGELRYLSPDSIERNPENPRMFFRPEELDTLAASIRKYGIQVPLTVYRDRNKYFILDGERRWRCATKLNLKEVPALVQRKPTRLQNLLLMFNIHALREQWDYLTIANKLPAVIDLFEATNGSRPTEQALSDITGLSRGQIRRCRLLIELPEKYRKILEAELALPKRKQTLSEDFFIEMERALKTIFNRLPEAIPNKDRARGVLISKFRKKVIGNVTDFRRLSKIATSVGKFGVTKAEAIEAILAVLDPNNLIGVEEVYSQRFEPRLDLRKASLNADALFAFLDNSVDVWSGAQLDREFFRKLKSLRALIDKVLKA